MHTAITEELHTAVFVMEDVSLEEATDLKEIRDLPSSSSDGRIYLFSASAGL